LQAVTLTKMVFVIPQTLPIFYNMHPMPELEILLLLRNGLHP
jgi:hypothetical protein